MVLLFRIGIMNLKCSIDLCASNPYFAVMIISEYFCVIINF